MEQEYRSTDDTFDISDTFYSNEEQSLASQNISQTSKTYYLNQQAPNYQSRNYAQNIILLLAIVLISIAFYPLEPSKLQTFSSARESNPLAFKKTLWLYTENEFQAETMYELVYIHHLNQTFSKQGYAVNFVNSLNAYDFLSDATATRITKAMQINKLDEGVHNVLKLALLAEYGGVVLNSYDTIIADQDLGWVEGIFAPTLNNRYDYEIPAESAEVFLYGHKKAPFQLQYSDRFIAARPNSTLIREAFQALQTLISTGTHPYAKEAGILTRNRDTAVDYLAKGLSDVFTLLIYKHKQETQGFRLQSYFGLQSLKHENCLSFKELSYYSQTEVLTKQDYQNTLKKLNHKKRVDLVFDVNREKIKALLDALARDLNLRDPGPLPQNSLLKKVLSAPGNKEVFVDKLPKRDIELCLIVMEDLSKAKIDVMRSAFKRQTYKHWKLVIPSEAQAYEPSQRQDRVRIMPGKSNKVHNIERACTQYCDPKGYAVLLNFGDSFNSDQALQEIANTVEPRDAVGAYIGLEHGGSLFVPQAMKFRRVNEGIVNPNIPKMETILNHFRVFSIEVFRYMPQFDLRDIYGNYFEDRLIFLMTIIEIVYVYIQQPRMHYMAKKYAGLFNIPNSIKAVNSNTFLRVLQKESLNREQLRLTQPRLSCESIYDSILQSTRWKVPFTKLLVFNPGNEFVSVNDRKGPQLIPKVVHQIWLGEKLPIAKEYFYKKTQKMYPDYEVKLYRNQDITREKFPLTYDIVQNLLEFNKRSPWSKLATVTDILRHQLLYHEGGFWKDAGMNLLRPVFDKFLTYKIAIPVDRTFRYRWLQGMCFFANAPKLQNLWRITSFRNTNRMRIYSNHALMIAGPIDFRQYIIGQEEYDPDILTMPYETFYPAQFTEHPNQDLCLKKKEEIGSLKYEIEENGCYLLPDCDKIYPLAFAVEHNCFGNSWASRKGIWPWIY